MLGDKVGAHQILLPKHFFQPIGGMNNARKIYRGEALLRELLYFDLAQNGKKGRRRI